jgi:hypothetical protein
MQLISHNYSYNLEGVSGSHLNATRALSLFELAVDDREYEQNQNRNNSNGYNPICSHPE